MELLPLDLLQPGEWGEVSTIEGEASWVTRLAELGLREGERVQMLRPGSPCMLLVEGGRISLRGEATMLILVRPVPTCV